MQMGITPIDILWIVLTGRQGVGFFGFRDGLLTKQSCQNQTALRKD